MRLAPLLCLLLVGCAPTELTVLATTDLGVVPHPDGVLARDGGASAVFGERSVWLFSEAVLEAPAADGATVRDSSLSWTDTMEVDPATGLRLTESVDATGAPAAFLPATAAEDDFAATHPGARLALWPGPVVADPRRDRALVFYWKVHAEPSGFTGRGLGVALWTDPDAAPERPVVDAVEGEPTLLFGPDALTPGNAAVLNGQWIHAYACPDSGCRLARVHADEVLDPAAWRWYQGLGDWSPAAEDALPLFTGAERMSVHWSETLSRWLVVYAEPGTNAILGRTASALEGPWSEPTELFRTVVPSGPEPFVSAGLAHGELATDGFETISYVRSTDVWESEQRLVRVELEMLAPE